MLLMSRTTRGYSQKRTPHGHNITAGGQLIRMIKTSLRSFSFRPLSKDASYIMRTTGIPEMKKYCTRGDKKNFTYFYSGHVDVCYVCDTATRDHNSMT